MSKQGSGIGDQGSGLDRCAGRLRTACGTLCCLAVVLLVALPAEARSRPHYGGTLRVEIEGDPWQRPNGLARRLVLDGLTTMSADGSPLPALAVDWKAENDSHRWQFRLRPGVHFQDGSALTSTVVVAALNTACANNCPWTAIHAVGTWVVFTGDNRMPNLPSLLAGDQYLISLPGSLGSAPSGFLGTGPFQPSGFANGALTLTANDNCWQGRPFLDSILISTHKTIHDQWLDLSFGRADLAEVPAEQLRQAREQRLTVIASPPVTLLALQIADYGALGNPSLRAAIALAVDRGALSNVIFQKQGEVTASLLPAALTGYAFLFPTDRDLNKAHELRGGIAPPPLTLTAEAGAAMQLAAQRIALNLREAGFNVQVAPSGAPHADLALRRLPLESNQPQAALESLLRAAGHAAPVDQDTPVGVYTVERDFLAMHTLVPLLYLPRAYAASSRVRDLRLSADGTPLLAAASLQDTP